MNTALPYIYDFLGVILNLKELQLCRGFFAEPDSRKTDKG